MSIWRYGVIAFVASTLAGVAVVSAANTTSPMGAATAGVDRIVVDKLNHRMTLERAGRTVRVYKVALGRGGLKPKSVEGDGRVPDGVYRIIERKVDSRYHLALRIGYPLPTQIVAARARGVDPGGDVMIHGLPNGFGWIGGLHRIIDWTAGCIAVTDAEMDEIWQLVPIGTTVEIRTA